MHVSSAPLILEGRHPSFLHTYCRAIRCPLEASSLTLSTTFQIPCQLHHSLPSIAAIIVWCPTFSCQLRNLGTTISCDPLTCAATSASPFHLRSFSLLRHWPDLDYQRAHLMPLLQLLPALPAKLIPPLLYHRIQGTHGPDSCRRPLLLHCLHHKPSFSVLGPNIIVGHKTGLK